jgi:hypothetical protein
LFGGFVGHKAALESLHKIKREIQTSASAALFEERIVRRGNILISKGFTKAGFVINKLAQAVTQDVSEETEKDITPPAPVMSTEPQEEIPVPEETVAPVEELGDGKISGEQAMEEFVESVNSATAANDELSSIVVTAQPISPPLDTPVTPIPEREIEQPMPSDIEVSDEPIDPGSEDFEFPRDKDEDFDLNNITVDDIIEKLELVSNILKNREIPRQLSMIDLMMDKLGIASFFPTLGEATRSALESNQYMSTRIVDILAKLRGSISPPDDEQIDLTVNENQSNLQETLKEEPVTDSIPPKPPLPMPEELTAPVKVKPPVPVKPAPPITPKPVPPIIPVR